MKESKKQLKMMIQQDRDRNSAAHEDLTKNDSRVMKATSSMTQLRDEKSISHAQLEKISNNSQY